MVQFLLLHILVLSAGVEQEVARIISGARPRQRLNGKSRSMDSIVHLAGDCFLGYYYLNVICILLYIL